MRKGPLIFALIPMLFLSTGIARLAVVGNEVSWYSPRISIVWPHDESGRAADVREAPLVNVSVWPPSKYKATVGGMPPSQYPLVPAEPVSCSQPPQNVVLYYAKDNEHVEPISNKPVFVLRSYRNMTFPSLEYNDIPVEPRARNVFLVEPAGNVWVHAADPRTFYPHPVVPTGFAKGYPREIDARIQVVWPHDGQGHWAPVEKATYVNVAIELFAHHTLKAIRNYDPFRIVLYVAEGSEPIHPAVAVDDHGRPLKPPVRVSYQIGDREFVRWVYNDIPVNPKKQYHFLVRVEPLEPWPEPPQGAFRVYSSIWTHAANGRTLRPYPEVPLSCRE